mgnify:CR=1 FL=1
MTPASGFANLMPTQQVSDMLDAAGAGRASALQQAIGRGEGAGGFSLNAIGTADAGGGDEAALRASAEELVGMALFLPLLKQARENPFRTDLFHGGQGEDAFAARLDEELADRLAKRSGGELVEAIVSKWRAAEKPNPRKIDTHG